MKRVLHLTATMEIKNVEGHQQDRSLFLVRLAELLQLPYIASMHTSTLWKRQVSQNYRASLEVAYAADTEGLPNNQHAPTFRGDICVFASLSMSTDALGWEEYTIFQDFDAFMTQETVLTALDIFQQNCAAVTKYNAELVKIRKQLRALPAYVAWEEEDIMESMVNTL